MTFLHEVYEEEVEEFMASRGFPPEVCVCVCGTCVRAWPVEEDDRPRTGRMDRAGRPPTHGLPAYRPPAIQATSLRNARWRPHIPPPRPYLRGFP